MRTIQAKCQSGVCPLCGDSIEFDDDIKSYAADSCQLHWTCSCGASGYEGRVEVFDGSHYDVVDPSGEPVCIEDLEESA